MVTTGAIASGRGLVADALPTVTFTRPVVAAAGTVAVSLLADTTWNRALIPWMVTRFAPFNLTPVTVTIFPALARAGETERIDGPRCTCTTEAADDGGAATRATQQIADVPAKPTLIAARAPPSNACRGLPVARFISALFLGIASLLIAAIPSAGPRGRVNVTTGRALAASVLPLANIRANTLQ